METFVHVLNIHWMLYIPENKMSEKRTLSPVHGEEEVRRWRSQHEYALSVSTRSSMSETSFWPICDIQSFDLQGRTHKNIQWILRVRLILGHKKFAKLLQAFLWNKWIFAGTDIINKSKTFWSTASRKQTYLVLKFAGDINYLFIRIFRLNLNNK